MSKSMVVMSCCFGVLTWCCAAEPQDETDLVVEAGKADSTNCQLGNLEYKDIQAVVESFVQFINDHCEEMEDELLLSQAVDFLKRQPNVREASYSKGNEILSLVFTNGMHYLWSILDVEESTTKHRVAESASKESSAPAQRSSLSTSVSYSSTEDETHLIGDKMVFVDLVPNNRPYTYNTAELVYETIKSYNIGDPVYGGPDNPRFANVDFFKTLHQYDLVFVHGHGSFYPDLNTYYIYSGEYRNRQRDEQLWNNKEFQTGRVVFSDLIIRSRRHLARVSMNSQYLVTARFLQKYLGRFGDQSMVILDTCNSVFGYNEDIMAPGTSLPGTLTFKNVHTQLGWSGPAHDAAINASTLYMFDRLLGDNVETKISPPNIPHTVSEVAIVSEKKGYNKDPRGGATFEELRLNGNSNELILRPAIDRILLDPKEDMPLTIRGTFMNKGGKICLGNDCRPIAPGADWQSGEIHYDLPTEYVGPIAIEQNGRRSNEIVLNEWIGNVVLTAPPQAPCKLTANMRIRFRCDLRAQRYELDGQVGKPSCGAMLDKDSLFEAKVEGEKNIGSGTETGKYTCSGSTKGSGPDFLARYISVSMSPDATINISFPIQTEVKLISSMGTQTTRADFTVSLSGKVIMTPDGTIQIGEIDYVPGTTDTSWLYFDPQVTRHKWGAQSIVPRFSFDPNAAS